jgi:SAM-dependent methyltransferase
VNGGRCEFAPDDSSSTSAGSIPAANPGFAMTNPESRAPDPGIGNELGRLRAVWGELGREDPLWAVLSLPHKRGGRWDRDEFFATGRREIDGQLAMLAARDASPRGHAVALDFGAGAGRLSRALAAHFDRVIGIDVSPSMVAAARELNRDIRNLEFRENASSRLDGIADRSVDFVYSCMTLQHIPARLALGYVEEWFRVLAPGGVALFQFVAATDASLRGRLFAHLPNRWLNPLRRVLWRRSAVFEMHVLGEAQLHGLLDAHPDLHLVASDDDRAAGPGWRGRRWLVVREP